MSPGSKLKAQAEVDAVVGDNVVTLDHLSKLPYIDACIKETLRLNSPISAFGVIPKKDTTIGNGKYKLYRGDAITFNVKGLHHDPAAWSEDHNVSTYKIPTCLWVFLHISLSGRENGTSRRQQVKLNLYYVF